jgi:Protein of unknown function (DUF1194)
MPVKAGTPVCLALARVMGTVLLLSSPAHAEPTVDLNLVFAVDCSGSVDGREFQLQLDGISAALRDPEVLAAIKAGPHQGIAVNLLLWGDPDEPKLDSGWYHITDQTSADTAANMVRQSNIRIGGGTGIGVAIGFAVSLLKGSPYPSTRQTIDVSGDGIESWELREPRFKLLLARDLARSKDITVNGLAIAQDDKTLDDYYRKEVIVGPGAFVVRAESYESFAEAMKKKLLREILPDVAALQ